MQFDRHSELQGRHATLSPSSYHWLFYDDDKVADMVHTRMAAARGTRLHEVAKELIELGIKLPEGDKTLNLYVNDAIGWKLKAEQVLAYRPIVDGRYSYAICFGTADAIGFTNRENGPSVLRVSDLKTGVSPASFHQLEIYAALFCLEYDIDPADIDIELRIYQNDAVALQEADLLAIVFAMDQIRTKDKIVRAIQEEVA